MINQTGNTSFFPIVTCTAHEIITENGVHACIWSIPEDLPIFDISNFALHVQYFAQSLNSSPEANNDIVYLDSQSYFYAENQLQFNDNRINSEAGSASTTRAFGWGIITIFSVAIILQRLWRVLKENENNEAKDDFSSKAPFIGYENE